MAIRGQVLLIFSILLQISTFCLAEVTKQTESPDTSFSCTKLNNEEYKLSVTGKVLDFSKALKKPCPSKITVMVLTAIDKIIINENHSTNGVKGMQVTISAPVWEIISDRVVNFDGTKNLQTSSNSNSKFTFFGGLQTIIRRQTRSGKNDEQKNKKKTDPQMKKKFMMFARL